MSKQYDTDSMDLIDERIWGILDRMKAVPEGGAALDIGCGTGSLTSRLASKCSRVLGLDFSPGMLSVAERRCGPLGNVDLLCQGWEEYSCGRDFDLVFSSFCPAIDDLSSMLRMDVLSRDRCCIVSLGGSSGDSLAFDIWEELGYPGMTMEGFDPAFPRRLLEEMGKRPSLRSFDVREEYEIEEERMVRHLVRYFSLFHPVDDSILEVIRRRTSEKAVHGELSVRQVRTISVLSWEAGLSSGSW